ncbi:MAG: imidazolonepropionase [Prevotella sp.]|nr:imidazolonepropionase [Prevotella sp.]
MKTLIHSIGTLAGIRGQEIQYLQGKEMASLPSLNDAWLLIEDDHIHSWGGKREEKPLADTYIDAHGGTVLPTFCDSHTHLVYAGSREQEFVDKIHGLDYAEIARRGGGILNSADRLHDMSEEALYQQAMGRVEEIMRKGTGAVEIKSGYGLNTEDELKMLRVIRRIKETSPLMVVSTFLGAHAVGREYVGRQGDYVNLVIEEMIPEVGKQRLADFIDVFCDKGFFTPDETSRILEAGAKWGLRPKIHGQELADSGGVDVAVRHHALSVDHLESMTERDIALILEYNAGAYQPLIPTALPGTSFFLNLSYAPGRRMIDEGLPLALASDYNPGSTPSGDMKFVLSLACIKMRLTPEETINAATLNSASAMGLANECGSITQGKYANVIITQPIPSIDFIPYAYTSPLISLVILNGNVVYP